MTKHWCDACEREIVDNNYKNVGIPCHLYSMSRSGNLQGGYVDREFQPISGRDDNVLLCHKCLNKGWSAFLTKLDLNGEKRTETVETERLNAFIY